MNFKFSICGFLLLTFAAANAQVASHAPTVFRQTPDKGAETSAPPTAEKPVVRVNGSVLTEADLLREEYAIFPYARQHSGLPKDLAPQIRDGAMKMIIFEELVYQEAQRRNMTVPAAKMERAESDFRKQFTDPDEFKTLFQSEFHNSRQLLRQKIRRSLLIDAFLKTEVEDKSTVSPAEVKSYYDSNPIRFQHPETFTFQTISVLPPANASADQLKEGRLRAESALRQAKAAKTSEQFGLLAEKISDDDYRVMMGQHKPVPVDQLAPQVLKTLLAMRLGEISGVIQVEQAFTIVHLQAHSPAGEAKFEDVKAQLEIDLHQNKRNQLRSALDKKLQKDAKIQEM